MSSEKTRKLGALAKLFQPVRSRTICWQDCRTITEVSSKTVQKQ